LAISHLLWLGFAQFILSSAAIDQNERKLSQTFSSSETGLVKISIPLETLTALRNGFEDLRLSALNETEVPHALQKPRSQPPEAFYPAPKFRAQMVPPNTVLTFEIEEGRPAEMLFLETTAAEFAKAITLEGSVDGKQWKLMSRRTISRKLHQLSDFNAIFVPKGNWRQLRITIDDQNSKPIPFLGARIYCRSPQTPTK
jgi:hypothetical protein